MNPKSYFPSNSIVVDSVGRAVYPDSWPQTLVYNPDDTLNYIEITDGTSVWRQTYSYTNGKVTSISAWVLQ